MRCTEWCCSFLLVVGLYACGDDTQNSDDAAVDAEADSAVSDSGTDAQFEDAGSDAGEADAGTDAGFDAGQLTCEEGLLACGAECVDPLSTTHCGTCNNTCSETARCLDGNCIEPGSAGCADGEREGYLQQDFFPAIAACAGGFDVGGVSTAASCDHEAGDDSANPNGTGCGLADLCAKGWHVCEDARELVGLAGGFGCTAAIDGTDRQFYAMQATGAGPGTCDLAGNNDVLGCGNVGTETERSSCFHIRRYITNEDDISPWDLGESASEEALNVTKSGPALGGAMCCADQLSIGCADGQREGFRDLEAFPAIAGCSGGFDQPGVTSASSPTATCGHNAGDDSDNPNGTGCSVEDLCTPGWHVCRSAAEIAFFSSRVINPFDCLDGVRGDSNLFFATRQLGTAAGQCGIDGTGAIFGCGTSDVGLSTDNGGDRTCDPLNRFLNDVDLSGDWTLSGPEAEQATRVVKPTPDGGGVLCCPNITGA